MEFTTSTTKPTATTLAASSITETTAILNGTVNANGFETTVIFEYGTTDTYGTEINATQNPVTGSTDTDVSASSSNLLAGTTYHYRVKAENSGGISYGGDMVFNTNAYAINIVSPENGDHWVGDEEYEITWEDNIDENVIIKFYKDEVFQDDIIETPGIIGNSYSWTVPIDLVYAKDYTIRVMSVNDNTLADTSEVFTMSEQTGATGSVTDRETNPYSTIKIGKQWWMAQNLKVRFYSDGEDLVNGTGVGDISEDYTTKYYFAYGDIEANVTTYGRLYTWAAAMNGESGSDLNPSGVQGICPTGWHLPSDAEWKEMEIYIGMSAEQADLTGIRGTSEGGELKDAGTVHWANPNTGATNEYLFNALPGGYFYFTGGFYQQYNQAYFWSSSDNDSDVMVRLLTNNLATIIRNPKNKAMGMSVRCVMD